MKYGFLAVDDERVTRIMAALKPHNGVGTLGEEIYNRALTLIAPLGTDDDNVSAQLQLRTTNNKPIPTITIPRPTLRNWLSSN